MSFAATKNTRYLSFALPFLMIVWGLGLASILPMLWRYADAARIRLTESLALPQRLGSIIGNTVCVIALSIVVLTNPFWLRTATLISNVALPFETPVTNWPAAREALSPWLTGADIMVTTRELGAIYFLGRSDILFSPSKRRELYEDQDREFGIDHRTGRPVIAEQESLEQLIECFPHGFIVGPVEHWGDPIRVNKAIQSMLTKNAKPIEVPKESYLFAWGWNREPLDRKPDFCSSLDRFSRKSISR
jgi:hypothetical protein